MNEPIKKKRGRPRKDEVRIKEEKKPKGRPTLYNQEIEDLIIKDISEGKTLRQICRENKCSYSMIYEWLEKKPSFYERFVHARKIGFDAIADECIRISDDGTNDYMEYLKKTGEKVIQYDRDNVNRSRLRVETRLKLLAKWFPQKYSDKTGEGEKIEIVYNNVLAK